MTQILSFLAEDVPYEVLEDSLSNLEITMFETIYAQLRFATSMLFGRPFDLHLLDRLIDSLLETQREFGLVGQEAGELLAGPTLDEETRREIQLRRFRTQAKRGAQETAYYQELFA